MKYQNLIQAMTLEEKSLLCDGLDHWHTRPIPRLNIPSIMVADGPHGLRKQPEAYENLGLGSSVPATCFPTASTLAASWDRELIAKIGAALAEECLENQVSVVLGPGTNKVTHERATPQPNPGEGAATVTATARQGSESALPVSQWLAGEGVRARDYLLRLHRMAEGTE